MQKIDTIVAAETAAKAFFDDFDGMFQETSVGHKRMFESDEWFCLLK